jgi:hypothetical protein
MENTKRNKWDIGVAIDKGNQSVSLVEKYAAEMIPRLQPDELAQHKANVAELGLRWSGQKETLTNMKSKTIGQVDAVEKLYSTVASIRSVVKGNSSATGEILKAFGVGEKTHKTVPAVRASGNIILTAYNAYTAWCNQAGIIEADIIEIQELILALSEVDAVQESAKFIRKSKTMDKNKLQRAVEDEITRLSVLGAHVFRSINPSVAVMFAGLRPATYTKAEMQPVTNTSETKI